MGTELYSSFLPLGGVKTTTYRASMGKRMGNIRFVVFNRWGTIGSSLTLLKWNDDESSFLQVTPAVLEESGGRKFVPSYLESTTAIRAVVLEY